MDYAELDPVIDAWCAAHGLVLFTEFAGRAARFAYASSARNECFQFSIEPPVAALAGQEVTVNIWSIETIDDEDLHYAWTVPVGALEAALALVWAKFQELKTRPMPAQA